jgi:hypothetical protein
VSRDFVRELRPPGARLANDLSVKRLQRGTRVPAAELPAGVALPAAAAAGPAGRAQPGSFFGSAAGWAGALALLSLAGIATRRLARG